MYAAAEKIGLTMRRFALQDDTGDSSDETRREVPPGDAAQHRRTITTATRRCRTTVARSFKGPVRAVERLALRPWAVRRELIGQLLQDPASREWILTGLRWRQIVDADFDRQAPSDIDEIRGFEDCYWLFQSSPSNCALSQLRFDEAADLYHRIAGLDQPRVAELGRYKGGTTLLLAAAGAEVLSLDNDADGGQGEFVPALERALKRFDLDEHVEPLVADVLDYDVERSSFDLVLMHCSPDYELSWGVFRHWWPTVKPGGSFIFHLTPELPGEVEMVKELQADPAWADVSFEPDLHGENLYARKIAP
jgi:hypothetical protein